MTTAVLTLADFLLARIAEDEAVARAAIEDDGGSDKGFSGQHARLIAPPSGVGIAQGGFGDAAAHMIATYAVPARVLAECEAKRRIVLRANYYDSGAVAAENAWAHTLRDLAAVYADHPDYRSEWAPS